MSAHSLSSGYATEPQTSGKVLMKTSIGDLDIELWSKQCPMASRNFIQLCMEGHYNNTTFHRIIKDFMAQGGDPTGTGTGGESIYGAPFKDEFHSRLKFNRRGLIAMANDGKNRNLSQFFVTLGACDWLQKKHTLFGKVTGDTVYNILKFNEINTDDDDHPDTMIVIKSTEVLSNPFPDIVPRKRAKPAEQTDGPKKKKKKKRKKVKNTSLLSFGDEADDEVIIKEAPKKKLKAKHDVDAEMYASDDEEPIPKKKQKKVVVVVKDTKKSEATSEMDFEAKMREKVLKARALRLGIQPEKKQDAAQPGLAADENLTAEEKARREYEELKRALIVQRGAKRKRDDGDEEDKEATELEKLKQQFVRPLQNKKQKKEKQKEQLSHLSDFEQQLKQLRKNAPPVKPKQWSGSTVLHKEQEEASEESDSDFDPSWFQQQLSFPKRVQDRKQFNLDDYEITDPRNPVQRKKGIINPRVTQNPKEKTKGVAQMQRDEK